MALPTSGQITLAQIAAEFGGSPPYNLSQFYRGGGRVTTNNTNVPTSGPIGLGNFYGAVKSVAGSVSYTSPGTYSFTIPVHQTLIVDVRGAGGGGGDMGVNYGYGIQYDGWPGGTAGGYSAFGGSVVGYGGGRGGSWGSGIGAGAHGTGAGGNTNNITAGGAVGGSGSCYIGYCGYSGGYGGRATSTWGVGSWSPGGVVTIVVGAKGTGSGSPYQGYAGGDGAVYISWT